MQKTQPVRGLYIIKIYIYYIRVVQKYYKYGHFFQVPVNTKRYHIRICVVRRRITTNNIIKKFKGFQIFPF